MVPLEWQRETDNDIGVWLRWFLSWIRGDPK